MPSVTVSDDLYERVNEFKQVVEVILEETIDLDTCMTIILSQGINSMLADLLGPVDQETLVRSFQQLGEENPVQVYKFVAETLMVGRASQERERLKRQIGFQKEK